uniref:Plastocyanin-like domain-containing protein n=1 Tax=Meloidogyne hapla TaxID=6305 RepID=A0A1I8BBA0_MELHA
MLPMGRYLRLKGLIFILNFISIVYGRHHYVDPEMSSLPHQNHLMVGNKHPHSEVDHQMIGNKRPHSDVGNPVHLDGPHNFVRKTNKKRKIVENPKIMLVIWGANGEIIEDPHIMLRHMEKADGVVTNAEHLPRTECHNAHNDFHQKHDPNSEAIDHRNILHLFYHNFKPYTYIYHIHGIIFWRGPDKENPSPVPLIANDGCAHVEYDIDHGAIKILWFAKV